MNNEIETTHLTDASTGEKVSNSENSASENNYQENNSESYQPRRRARIPNKSYSNKEDVTEQSNVKHDNAEKKYSEAKSSDSVGLRRQYEEARYQQNGDHSNSTLTRPNNYQPRYQQNRNKSSFEQNGYKLRYRQEDRYSNNGNNQLSDWHQRQDGYQPRGGYQRQDGYQPRGGYQRQDGYQPRGGYQRQDGYRPRGGYQRQDGYSLRRSKNYDPQAKYSLKKRIEYKEEHIDPNEPIRLNKYLANSGICSRREADEYIMAGNVSVNGVVISELGTKVKRSDEVLLNGKRVTIEKKMYVLLNKPKGYVTTSDDPDQRPTVMDLVKDACQERIYPVGRLDRNTTGVLLFTNDGELATKLTHPKYMKKKIYHVTLDKPVTLTDMQTIADGVELEDGEAHADAIEYIDEHDRSQVGIEIHSGKNRIVRRIFESLGYRVTRLDRTLFAGLTKKNLRRGDWRYLTENEVEMLRMGAFE